MRPIVDNLIRRLINYLIILDSLDNLNQNCRYQNPVASYTLVLVIRDNCLRIYNSFFAHLPPNYCLQFRIRVKLASHFLCPHIDIDHRDSTSKKIKKIEISKGFPLERRHYDSFQAFRDLQMSVEEFGCLLTYLLSC